MGAEHHQPLFLRVPLAQTGFHIHDPRPSPADITVRLQGLTEIPGDKTIAEEAENGTLRVCTRALSRARAARWEY